MPYGADQTEPGAAPSQPGELRIDIPGPKRVGPGQATVGDARQGTVDFWISKGANPEAAQGIADRIIGHESGGNPTIVNPTSGATGLYQDLGSRKDRLLKLPNWQDPMVQHENAYAEVTGGDPIATAHWDEIKNAPNKATGAFLWDKYFERSGAATGGYGKDAVVGVPGKFRVADEAITGEQQRGRSVYQMDPRDYLAMLPPIEDNDREKAKGALLSKSLDAAEEIYSIPEVRGEVKDGRYVITDYDGRHRAEAAIAAGVTQIPVAVAGLGSEPPKTIQGMTGILAPFDYKVWPKPPASDNATEARRLRDRYGILGGAGMALVEDVGDIFAGLAQGAREGGEALTGQPGAQQPGQSISDPTLNTVLALAGTRMGAGGALERPGAPVAAAAATTAPQGASAAPAWAYPVTPQMTRGGVEGFLGDVGKVTEVENRARDVLSTRFGQAAKGGGISAEGAALEMMRGRAAGQPMTLADLSQDIRALVGSKARQGGPARQRVVDWSVNRMADVDRDSPIAAGIERRINDLLSTGSARSESKRLVEQRSANRPLWDKAMASGSMAPLRRQFENAWNEISRIVKQEGENVAKIENEVTTAAARQSQAGNVYSASAANRARRFADDKIAERRTILEAAERQKSEMLDLVKRAQADETAKAPGAVWSPYLERLRKNRYIQQGISRGMDIEKNLADAANTRFNPKDYAIIGEDAQGAPIVGAVANMKLWAVAKEGLDAIAEDHLDPETGRYDKFGKSIIDLLKGGFVDGERQFGLLGELDRLNPNYKAARDAWAGDSASIAAVRMGEKFHRQTPEEIRDWFSTATKGEQDFYRLGAADTMRDDLDRVAINGDPSKAIVNTRGARERIRAVSRSSADADQLIDSIKRGRKLFDTPVQMLRNSETASRMAEDRLNALGDGGAASMLHAGLSAATGYHHNALMTMLRPGMHKLGAFLSPPDLAVNDAIARLALDPNLALDARPGEALLRSIPLPHVQNALKRGMMNWSRQFAYPPPGVTP